MEFSVPKVHQPYSNFFSANLFGDRVLPRPRNRCPVSTGACASHVLP